MIFSKLFNYPGTSNTTPTNLPGIIVFLGNSFLKNEVPQKKKKKKKKTYRDALYSGEAEGVEQEEGEVEYEGEVEDSANGDEQVLPPQALQAILNGTNNKPQVDDDHQHRQQRGHHLCHSATQVQVVSLSTARGHDFFYFFFNKSLLAYKMTGFIHSFTRKYLQFELYNTFLSKKCIYKAI